MEILRAFLGKKGACRTIKLVARKGRLGSNSPISFERFGVA